MGFVMCGCVYVWVCVCVGFVMCGCVYVCVCVCVGMCMCGCMGFVMCGCVYVWVCVCVGFVMCGCLGNMYRLILFTVFCIVPFMYIYSHLFRLYQCKDYCHRVTTQLQLVIIIKLIIHSTNSCTLFPVQPGYLYYCSTLGQFNHISVTAQERGDIYRNFWYHTQ